MKKKSEIKKLKERLDDVFQMVIRYRDNFTCITCGAKFPKGERFNFHAGHYIGRGCNSTRWDEENVNGQCRNCNCRQSNKDAEIWYLYTKNLKLKYGDDVIDRLLAKKHQTFKLTRPWLEEQIKYYSDALKEYEKK